jgi:Na+-transporting methylmalonyl-CoA/oxaloacetate decarboxylase gamma subunit
MSIQDAGLTAIFGYATVFCGLLILMAVLYAMGAVFRSIEKKKAAKQGEEKTVAPVSEEAPEAEKPLAPGSAGKVKRYDVPDKEAAMVMAVVANKMQKPLNELRFISIKEVKEDEV